jgi:iron(III) transport system permease protein
MFLNQLGKHFQKILLVFLVGPLAFMVIRANMDFSLSDEESWSFVLTQTVPSLLSNTFWLIIWTNLFTLVFGLSQSILVTLSNIRFKRILNFLFILPLAFPLYVISFLYLGLFEFSGEFSTYLRESVGFNLNQALDIKSAPVIGFIFSLVLAPYAYLFFKSALLRFDKKLIWSGRILGRTPIQVFFSLIMPNLRKWMFAVSILITSEVICDFGGVSVFNFETFSIAIYEAWISLFSLNSAVKLSLFPMAFILILYFVNARLQLQKGHLKEHAPIELFKLSGLVSFLIWIVIILFAVFSLGIPLGTLIYWAKKSFGNESLTLFAGYLKGSFLLSFIAAIVLTLIAFIYVAVKRFISANEFSEGLLKLGYALPGTIVGIAIIGFFSSFNMNYFGVYAWGALVLALVIRFFAPSLEIQDKAYQTISRKLDYASRSLGTGRLRTVTQVHLPLLRPTIISAFFLIFIEVLKEMPITLILRPHGLDTLSTKIYELTSEGEWYRASVYALVMVLFCLASLIMMNRSEGKRV